MVITYEEAETWRLIAHGTRQSRTEASGAELFASASAGLAAVGCQLSGVRKQGLLPLAVPVVPSVAIDWSIPTPPAREPPFARNRRRPAIH